MAAEKALAIVIRSVEFSETSCVVALLTREFGKIHALAKGGRRPKGPFESALDLLALCRIIFLRKSSDALDLLTEAKLERRFRPPPGDLASLYAAYYVAELLGEITHDHDPCPEIFDAALNALDALREAGGGKGLLRFELVALRLMGHMPSLDCCAECGREVAMEGRVPFSQWEGGVLCGRCRPGKTQVVLVNAGVLRLLGTLADPDDAAFRRAEIDARVGGELRAVLNHYWTHLLGHPLRTQRYLGISVL